MGRVDFLRRHHLDQVLRTKYVQTEARRKAVVRTWEKFEASRVSAAVMMAPESAAAGCQAESSEPMDVENSPTAPLEAAAGRLEPTLGHISSGEPARVADSAQQEVHGRRDVNGGQTPPSRRDGTGMNEISPRAAFSRQHREDRDPNRSGDGAMAPPAGPSLPGRFRAARGKDTRGVPSNAVESIAEYRLDQQTGAEPPPVKHFPVTDSVITFGWEVDEVRTWWASFKQACCDRDAVCNFDFRFKVLGGAAVSNLNPWEGRDADLNLSGPLTFGGSQ